LAVGPIASVGRPPDNPHVAQVVGRLRGRFGNRTLEKRGAVREMFRTLKSGGILGLLLDQRVRAEEAIAVPFFGRPAWTSPIVARLAQKTGAAVVPVFGDHLHGGRYRVDFHPELLASGDESDAAIVRANLLSFFALEALVSTLVLGAAGLLQWVTIIVGIFCAPFYFVGLTIGGKLFHRSSDQTYRLATFALILLSAFLALPLFDNVFETVGAALRST
jgi:lauroyl/myristoyl acyltransferase